MVRLAVVITRFIAGAGGVALRGALALDPNRYRVTVLAADGGPLLGEAERAGLEVIRLRHMRHTIDPREDFRCLGELTEHLRQGQFDLVHTHSTKAGALGRMAARRAGVPRTLHTFHGFPFHDFQNPVLHRTYLAVERRLAGITDYFLAVGSEVAADAVRLRIAHPDRVRVISPAIDLERIQPVSPDTRREARRRLHLPQDAVVIGTVGRLAPQKAPEHMLEAFRRLDRPDLFFVWIGGGPLSQKMEKLVARSGMQGRFRLAGERRDVAELLPGLDVFAMSSLYEGLPCSIAEAMVAGVPVVATAVNAVPELVVPGRTGILVPPAAPAVLARAMGHLVNSPGERQRMVPPARERVGETFDSRQLGRELDETYRRVAPTGVERGTAAAPTVAR